MRLVAAFARLSAPALAVALVILLSPSPASACGISYQNGVGVQDCSSTPPLIASVILGGAVAATLTILAVAAFRRGKKSAIQFTNLLHAQLPAAPPPTEPIDGPTEVQVGQPQPTTTAEEGGSGSATAHSGTPLEAQPVDASSWMRPATGVVGGSPTGLRTRVRDGEDENVRRSLQRENECADIMAGAGYRVQQNPTKAEVADACNRTGDVGGSDKSPDYLIEDHVFDCYSPGEGKAVRNVWSEVRKKIDDEQTQRVVLNLRDWGGDLSALCKQFDDWPVDGLKELTAVTSTGSIVQIVPRH